MADTQALVANPVEAYLEKFAGNYIAAYNDIVAEADKAALANHPRTNAELRKQAYQRALRVQDRKELKSIGQTLRGFLPLAKHTAEVLNKGGDVTLEEAEDVMVLVLEAKRLKEIAESQILAARKRIFAAIDERLAADGVDFPEVNPGYIEIPNLGLKFTREGGGRKDPELDEAKLEALVGPEVWENVTNVELIPAQEVRNFDADLFLQEARKQPALLEKLREALIVGEFAPVRFNQRAMEPEDEALSKE